MAMDKTITKTTKDECIGFFKDYVSQPSFDKNGNTSRIMNATILHLEGKMPPLWFRTFGLLAIGFALPKVFS